MGKHSGNSQIGYAKLGAEVYSGQFMDCPNPNFGRRMYKNKSALETED